MTDMIFSAGSWTNKVFAGLFLQAEIGMPMTGRQLAQTWIRIRSTQGHQETAPLLATKLGQHQEGLGVHVLTYSNTCSFRRTI